MVILRSVMLAIGVPILVLTGVALVLSKTSPNPVKSVEAYSAKEVAFLKEVSAAVAAEQTKYTPFDCKLPKHELVRVGLTALHQRNGATEVTVPSLETTLFVYWLQMDEGKRSSHRVDLLFPRILPTQADRGKAIVRPIVRPLAG